MASAACAQTQMVFCFLFFFLLRLRTEVHSGPRSMEGASGWTCDSPWLQPLRSQAQTSPAFLGSWVPGCREVRLGSDHGPSRPHGPWAPGTR